MPKEPMSQLAEAVQVMLADEFSVKVPLMIRSTPGPSLKVNTMAPEFARNAPEFTTVSSMVTAAVMVTTLGLWIVTVKSLNVGV